MRTKQSVRRLFRGEKVSVYEQSSIKSTEDQISSLPDCLLIEIISRLPCTKQAIGTGILSKRWKNLWTEVHNLIFKFGNLPSLKCDFEKRVLDFFSYIEKVLRRRGQLDLNKFQLDTPYYDGFDKQVNNWIRYAFSHDVKYLDLRLDSVYEPFQSEFVLDQFFFINSCVIHMKLNGCVFKPTGAISWSNLKSLCIVTGDLDEKLIENIISGSPVLKTLKLQNCEGFSEIAITSKSVKNLVFSGYSDNMDWNSPHVVKINAPHILSLTIEKKLKLGKVVLQNVSSLVKAKLDYYYESDDDYESDEPTSEDESDEPTSDDEGDFPTSWKKREERLKGLILSLRHVKKLKIGYHCQETLARLKAKGFTFPLHGRRYRRLSHV